jgi:hypothetical protein
MHGFDPEQFTAHILSPPWDELHLKSRIHRTILLVNGKESAQTTLSITGGK